MIFNMVGGGGGSGATLVVSSPANVSVTVSKDDKSYTKNSGSLGSATFKGLATGTWTVTISGNGQTATKTIKITADYAITIAFFAATINVTYPAGSTCAITTDPTNYSDAIFAGDTSGHWSFTVPYAGNWIVASYTGDISNPDKITYKVVSITSDGQSVSVTLTYELYLYKNGDRCTDVGGDWSFHRKYADGASISYGADKVTISLESVHLQYMGVCFWYKKIDITNYSKLCMLVTYNSATSATQGICVCSSVPEDPMESGSYDARQLIEGSSDTVPFELDISSITGSKYIGYGASMGGTDSGSVQIKEVYLV